MVSNIVDVISEEKPVGDDYKYEDIYIAIESEIDKTMSATASSDVDWAFIVESSSEILSNKSKDLKIASYRLYAEWKLRSWETLESSLDEYSKLIEVYESTLFPKSPKVKLRILEWLHESLTATIFQEVSLQEEVRVEVLISIFENLDKNIADAVKDEVAIFSPLIRKLKKSLKDRILENELNKVEEKMVKNEAKDIPNNFDKVEKKEFKKYDFSLHLQQIKKQISKQSLEEKESLLAFELTQVLGFNLLSKAFLEEKKLEEALFPTKKEQDNLLKFEGEESYFELLKVYIATYPCWIEGEYFMIKYLEISKENKYNSINLNTLKYNLINFINNNVENLHIYAPEDHKIVNDEIKSWINLEKKDATFLNNTSQFDEGYKATIALFKEKNKEEAIGFLNQLKEASKSAEESFLWRLKQVEFAFEIDNKNMAMAFLRDLDREIEAFNMTEWNPKLSIKVYVYMLKPSINKLLNKENKELIYGKLCRLSPKDAMDIGFL